MATFRDSKDRAWTLQLDGPLVKRIADISGIKLTELRADPILALSVDPVLLGDVLYLLCEKQAKEHGVSDIDFGESLVGKIDEAVAALEVAIADFFPSSKRSLLQSLQQKNREMQEKTMTKTMRELETNQEEIETALAKKAMSRMMKLLDSIDSDSLTGEESATSSTGVTP